MLAWKRSHGNHLFLRPNSFCKFLLSFFFERLPYVKKNPVCLPISLVVVKPPSCVFSFKDCKWYWSLADTSLLRVVVCSRFYLKSSDYVPESTRPLGAIRFFLSDEKSLLTVCRLVIGLNVVRSPTPVFTSLNDWRVCERRLFCCKWNFTHDAEIRFKKFKLHLGDIFCHHWLIQIFSKKTRYIIQFWSKIVSVQVKTANNFFCSTDKYRNVHSVDLIN